MTDNNSKDNGKRANFFYGVTEYAEGEKFKILIHRRSFSGPDLLRSREEAYEWYEKRKIDLINVADLLVPKDASLDTILLCTVLDLCIIMYIDETEYYEYYLEGRDQKEIEEGRLMEKRIFQNCQLYFPGTYSSQ